MRIAQTQDNGVKVGSFIYRPKVFPIFVLNCNRINVVLSSTQKSEKFDTKIRKIKVSYRSFSVSSNEKITFGTVCLRTD